MNSHSPHKKHRPYRCLTDQREQQKIVLLFVKMARIAPVNYNPILQDLLLHTKKLPADIHKHQKKVVMLSIFDLSLLIFAHRALLPGLN